MPPQWPGFDSALWLFFIFFLLFIKVNSFRGICCSFSLIWFVFQLISHGSSLVIIIHGNDFFIGWARRSRRRKRYKCCPIPIPSWLWGLGSVVSFPAGSRAEPRPKTGLMHFRLERTHLMTTNLLFFYLVVRKSSTCLQLGAWPLPPHLDTPVGEQTRQGMDMGLY